MYTYAVTQQSQKLHKKKMVIGMDIHMQCNILPLPPPDYRWAYLNTLQ